GIEHTFHVTEVSVNAVGQVLSNLCRDLNAIGLHLPVDDCEFGFEIRLLQIGGQAPFETREQTLLESFEITRRTITGHDDLFARLVQLVKNMEKHLLCFFTTGKKLDVIENEQVDLEIEILEVLQLMVLQGV